MTRAARWVLWAAAAYVAVYLAPAFVLGLLNVR